MRIEKTLTFTSKGNCQINREDVQYAGYVDQFTFLNEKSEAEATAFTFSYLRTNDNSGKVRPILFAYNGGPGSSSSCIHLGALGPQRIRMGDGPNINCKLPVEMENNPDTVLDICDIVLIDPVGCGYSRLLKEEAASKYYGTDADAAVTVRIICQWLTEHDRWNAPILLMGESYGTIRNALVADAVFYHSNKGPCNCNCMNLSGIVMMGSALDQGQSPIPVDSVVLNFSSVAATNWYHHPEGKPDLETFVKEANDFAYWEYMPALARGDGLAEDKREHLIERLTYFTGLEKETLLKLKLRVEPSQWPLLGMKKEGLRTGRYDGRFLLPAMEDTSNYDMFGDDPVVNKFLPLLAHCFNGTWKKKMNVTLPEPYETLNLDASWDLKAKKEPIDCLRRAMQRNPGLKVLFAAGYYDMVTPYGLAEYFTNCNLPKNQIRLEGYESGHMPYLGEKVAAKLGKDLHDFIRWVCE